MAESREYLIDHVDMIMEFPAIGLGLGPLSPAQTEL